MSKFTLTIPEESGLEVAGGGNSITIMVLNSAVGGSGGDGTNLFYYPTTRLLVSSTGTDVTLPLADDTNAGLLSSAEYTKLAGIEAGAEVNVSVDWLASSGDAAILNKPTLGTASALDVGTAALDVVQLDALAKLPAVDGSALTNLPDQSTPFATIIAMAIAL